MTVPKVVLGRELKQLGQKRILVLRCFKLYRVHKVEFLSRYFILVSFNLLNADVPCKFKCMTVPKVVLGRELKQLGQKRILVLRCFKLYRVYKVEFLSRYFI